MVLGTCLLEPIVTASGGQKAEARTSLEAIATVQARDDVAWTKAIATGQETKIQL